MILQASIYAVALFFTLGVIASMLNKVRLTTMFTELATIGVLLLTIALIIESIIKIIEIIV